MKKVHRSPRSLMEAVQKWSGRKVAILGDMILDEAVFGRTERVSREAPVVIVRYDGSNYSPGGAANAAQNIAALGGRAFAIGIAARDEGGSRLRTLLAGRGVSTGGIIARQGWSTTKKTRILAGDFHAQRQQIVRIDRENHDPAGETAEDRLLNRLEKKLGDVDAVILSDYNQGIFSDRVIKRAISMCRKAGVPTVADSRFRIANFVGVATATPNEVEAAAAADVDVAQPGALGKTGRILLQKLASGSVLVTRGRFGMSLFEPGRRIDTGVVGSPEATDVTGAGDTVVSVVALCLAAGEDMVTAMYLANIAASIVVMKRGTAVAAPEEIRRIISSAGGCYGK